MDLRKVRMADIEFRAYKFKSQASKDCRRKMARRAKRKCNRAWKKENMLL